jgi:hypothetical protein
MITAIAQTVTLFCMIVLVAAALAWLWARGRGSSAEPVATRIAITFAVFALAAGYIWLELGPDLDGRFAHRDRPLVAEPGPQPVDV